MKKYFYYLLPVASACLASLALFSEFSNYIVLVALVPLFAFFYKENKLRRLLAGVFLYHFIYALIIGLFITLEPLTVILSSLVFSFLALGLWLVKKYLPVRWFWLFTPMLFVLFEFIRSYLAYLPLKIIVLGNALGSTWLLPLSKLAGLWGLSLVVVAVNLSLVWLIIRIKTKNRIVLSLLTAGLIILVIVSLNFGLKFTSQRLVNNKTISIATISFQMTAPGKWQKYEELFSRLEKVGDPAVENYTKELINNIIKNLDGPVEYIFLPADIFDTERQGDTDAEAFKKWGISNNGAIISFSQRLAKATGSNIVIGLTTIESRNKKYNSILFFDNHGELKDVYHKADLVIVSEYWPFGMWVPFWFYWTAGVSPGERIYIDPGYTRGQEPIKPAELGNLSIGALVCSEAQDGWYFREVKRGGAELVFTPINNDWFSGLNLKFYQEMVLNHLRINSLYYDLPIVVNGKNNYVGIILPDGTFKMNRDSNMEDMTIWQGEVGVK